MRFYKKLWLRIFVICLSFICGIICLKLVKEHNNLNEKNVFKDFNFIEDCKFKSNYSLPAEKCFIPTNFELLKYYFFVNRFIGTNNVSFNILCERVKANGFIISKAYSESDLLGNHTFWLSFSDGNNDFLIINHLSSFGKNIECNNEQSPFDYFILYKSPIAKM
jgi:hypothetical protein